MKMMRSLSIFLVCCLLLTVSGQVSAAEIRIGVLPTSGPEHALQHWKQVSEYLTARIPEHRFTIVPIEYKNMERAVANGQLEFVVTNPSQYVDYQVKYDISRIATLLNCSGQVETPYFGSVIFTRADRKDITSLADLKGKSFVTVSDTAFAAWYVTRDELRQKGISIRDLASVSFTGIPTENVVMAVRRGEADAGSVRTDMLERMAREGKITLSEFRILNEQHVPGFPFLLSSELYPEFAFARLKHTDTLLANRVAAQLLLMPHDKPTTRTLATIGWTVPDNYEKVRKLLRAWKLPPYQDHGKVTVVEALRQHWVTVLLSFAVFIALMVVVFLSLTVKRRTEQYNILKEAKQKLDLVHAMIVATPDAIFIKDRQGRYVFVNPEAAKIIGKPVEDIIGKDDADLFPAPVAQAMKEDDDKVLSTASSLTYEEELALPEAPRYMLITKGPMYDPDGVVDGLFGVARDITDLKLFQKEITEQVVRLKVALSNVRQLEGMIPICPCCRKICRDEESWQLLEQYLTQHADIRLSHGLCPECMKKQKLKMDDI